MAANVFGNPVTDETLKAMSEYDGKQITRKDRAHVALNMKNAQDKAVNAQQYVENLSGQYGSGICTLCMIYNATGDMIELVEEHDWSGNVWKSPCPQIIANGQWGAFLHAECFDKGSFGTVVYRGMNEDDQDCDWMFAWYNPSSGPNLAYTEIREADHYANNKYWDYISGLVRKSNPTNKDTWKGCLSMVSIARADAALFEGLLTQADAIL
ncbi:hypothetical protein CFOL_v3_09902 [Cephalotus follicularis]|uniref:23 kDa jasmonate-induced protein-like n=1 Tax=Cephalotus follicularis TaxID=3775 RepID=A0A1Q3BEY1_CEPFO|nr:hypothetical protein CFOL_v3_09902 [Cephalotus follicularis]